MYRQPLDPTSAKKFHAMESLGAMFVVAFGNGILPARFVEGGRFFLLPRLPTPALRYLCLYSFGLLVLLKLVFRERVQVLVAQSPYEGFVAAMVKRIARLAGHDVALVVESHGDFVQAPFLQNRLWFTELYRRLVGFASRNGLARADVLRAISSATRDQLATWAPGKPIVSFPTWTDIDRFFEAWAPEEKDPRRLLYVGVLTRLKAVDVLIEAFARIAPLAPDATLRIVGEAVDAGYAHGLERRVEALGLASRIEFRAPMTQSELAFEMTRATALVLPSLSEGLGRVVLEAMASGTPVVGSRVGGIVDLIDDGETGFLVTPGDAESLAERLAWLLARPETARDMGARARERARTLFSTERYVAEYGRLFSLAMERSGTAEGE
jgi:glycosyltransferase involved in cell wall biosynthesis